MRLFRCGCGCGSTNVWEGGREREGVSECDSLLLPACHTSLFSKSIDMYFQQYATFFLFVDFISLTCHLSFSPFICEPQLHTRVSS
jgi:hypothetical protein